MRHPDDIIADSVRKRRLNYYRAKYGIQGVSPSNGEYYKYHANLHVVVRIWLERLRPALKSRSDRGKRVERELWDEREFGGYHGLCAVENAFDACGDQEVLEVEFLHEVADALEEYTSRVKDVEPVDDVIATPWDPSETLSEEEIEAALEDCNIDPGDYE